MSAKDRTLKENLGALYEKKWKWIGWLGAFLVILGYYLNANCYVSSWVVWTVGNLCVAGYSMHKKAYPTTAMSLIIAVMNIYGYFKWS